MQHPNGSDHARHDATLVAGHAAGDLTERERARADALIAECGACAELRRDLVALAAAVRSVPAPATLKRDLRLAHEQADRLRKGSWLRGFLRPFGANRSPLRPVAAAFTSLGVVGLVIGVTMSSALPQAGSATSGQSLQREDVQAPAPPATGSAPASAVPEAAGGFDAQSPALPVAVSSDGAYVQNATVPPYRTAMGGTKSQAPGRTTSPSSVALGDGGQGENPRERDDASVTPVATQSASLLIAGSLALFGIGLLLFGLRIASRRIR